MDISHELFSAFAFYAGLVLFKTLIMAFWTARHRFANGVSTVLLIKDSDSKSRDFLEKKLIFLKNGKNAQNCVAHFSAI